MQIQIIRTCSVFVGPTDRFIPTSCICVPCLHLLPPVILAFLSCSIWTNLEWSRYHTALGFLRPLEFFYQISPWGLVFSFCHFSIGLSGDGTLKKHYFLHLSGSSFHPINGFFWTNSILHFNVSQLIILQQRTY